MLDDKALRNLPTGRSTTGKTFIHRYLYVQILSIYVVHNFFWKKSMNKTILRKTNRIVDNLVLSGMGKRGAFFYDCRLIFVYVIEEIKK